MDLINGLLARYQKIFKDKQQEISLIISLIKEITRVTLKTDELKIKDGVLFIKTKPKYKLEIILKKKEILQSLNSQDIKVVDLR